MLEGVLHISKYQMLYYRDDVEWGEEQKRGAEEKVAENSHDLVAEGEREGYETAAAEYWDNFYQQHQNK